MHVQENFLLIKIFHYRWTTEVCIHSLNFGWKNSSLRFMVQHCSALSCIYQLPFFMCGYKSVFYECQSSFEIMESL